MKNEDFEDEITDFETNEADLDTVEKSLEAIRFQSITNLAKNTGLDVDTLEAVLSDLQTDGKVREQQAGRVTAYFLADNAPDGHLFLDGGGISESAAFDPQRAPEKSKPHGRQKIEIDAASVENMAAAGHGQEEIAKRLGIGFSTLQARMKSDAHLKAAYGRGKAKSKPAAEVVEKVVPTPEPVIEPEIVTDPRFEHTLGRISENGHSASSIEVVKAELIGATTEMAAGAHLSERTGAMSEMVMAPLSKVVSFSHGQLFIGFDGNLFELSRKERDLLNAVIDLVQEA